MAEDLPKALVADLPPELANVADLVERRTRDLLGDEPDQPPEKVDEARRLAVQYLLERMSFFRTVDEVTASPA